MARALGEPANQAELMVGTDLEGICSFPHAAVATNNSFFFEGKEQHWPSKFHH